MKHLADQIKKGDEDEAFYMVSKLVKRLARFEKSIAKITDVLSLPQKAPDPQVCFPFLLSTSLALCTLLFCFLFFTHDGVCF